VIIEEEMTACDERKLASRFAKVAKNSKAALKRSLRGKAHEDAQ
jgi:hypothetical protein